jgi:clathrin heavy chain
MCKSAPYPPEPPIKSLTVYAQTLESDSFVCVREKKNEAASPEVIIIDLKQGNNVTRRSIKADSAIMHWTKQVIALKAQSRTLQIFDLGAKAKLKSATMNEDVVFWKWFSETSLGLVTETAVYHWDVFDATQAAPVEVFKRNPNLQVSLVTLDPPNDVTDLG